MIKLTPATRLSLGLVFLTLSILVVAQSLGLIPSLDQHHLKSREQTATNLALQATIAVKRNDYRLMRDLLDTTVKQNANITALALKKANGASAYETSAHHQNWRLTAESPSTPQFMRIPILFGGKTMGSLEVSFTPLDSDADHTFGIPSYALLVIFVCASGFFAFWIYIKRVLHQLDPSSIVPSRVKNALNIMAEGVFILDNSEQVVLANEAIASILAVSEESLIGRKAAELGWQNENPALSPPWIMAKKTGDKQVNSRMVLMAENNKQLAFSVNAVPIKDGKGRSQGIIASFTNITELERKNAILKNMVASLSEKQRNIEIKNKELHQLASRDPLTDCFNRRTLFNLLDKEFSEKNQDLCIIMADIDHFKKINDTYGHNFGDQVIKNVADTLKCFARKTDIVARIGGEEFCMVILNTNVEETCTIAERCRKKIEESTLDGVGVTASFGVASIKFDSSTPVELINFADQALYKSKQDGRNRYTVWSPALNRVEKQSSA